MVNASNTGINTYISTSNWIPVKQYLFFLFVNNRKTNMYLHFVEFMEISRPEYWSGQPFPSPGDLPNPGIEPRSPVLWADSLPTEPPGKPKNTGVGSLFLLHQIFPNQESNWDLLHCRWILYQLSYQGSPLIEHHFLLNKKTKQKTR